MRGPQCGVGVSPHRALIEALCERGLNSPRVSRIIEAETQEKLPYWVIQRHARRSCLCR